MITLHLITYNNMPLIFRDTKGFPLTSAEADANIRQLAISATYTAGSGVAISATNVISALAVSAQPDAPVITNQTDTDYGSTVTFTANNSEPTFAGYEWRVTTLDGFVKEWRTAKAFTIIIGNEDIPVGGFELRQAANPAAGTVIGKKVVSTVAFVLNTISGITFKMPRVVVNDMTFLMTDNRDGNTYVNIYNTDNNGVLGLGYKQANGAYITVGPIKLGPGNYTISGGDGASSGCLSQSFTVIANTLQPVLILQETDNRFVYGGDTFTAGNVGAAFGGTFAGASVIGAFYQITIPAGYSQIVVQAFEGGYGGTYAIKKNGVVVGNGTFFSASGTNPNKTVAGLTGLSTGDVIRIELTGSGQIYADQVTLNP